MDASLYEEGTTALCPCDAVKGRALARLPLYAPIPVKGALCLKLGKALKLVRAATARREHHPWLTLNLGDSTSVGEP